MASTLFYSVRMTHLSHFRDQTSVAFMDLAEWYLGDPAGNTEYVIVLFLSSLGRCGGDFYFVIPNTHFQIWKPVEIKPETLAKSTIYSLT